MYNFNPYDPYGLYDDEDNEKPKKDSEKEKTDLGECICPKDVWMNRGCQCGAIERYELKPSKNAKHYL